MNGKPEGFEYILDFLSAVEQDDLLHKVRSLPYTHDKFIHQTMKRGYAQFGSAYVTTGRKLVDAPPIPPFLQAVNEDSSQQATRYPKEKGSEPARSKLRGIAPKEIEKAAPYYPHDTCTAHSLYQRAE